MTHLESEGQDTKISVPVSHLEQNYSSTPVAYLPYYASSYDPVYGHNFPIWNLYVVDTMTRDSRVNYGLKLLKGPVKTFTVFLPEEEGDKGEIHQALREQGTQFAYTVKSKFKEVAEFVLNTIKHFWEQGLDEYLTYLEWGYSVNQVIYHFDKKSDGSPDPRSIEYSKLTWIHPLWVKALTSNNKLVAAEVNTPHNDSERYRLFIPKLLWGVHNRKVHRYFGRSLLYDCYVPWHEMWAPFGSRDIRRTWFHKNSFDGGEMRYPIGKTTLPDGSVVDNRDLAAKTLANIRTGGGRILPSTVNMQNGKPEWEYIPPTSNVTPQGLMEYPEKLRAEILEGMGIPPEVVESSGDTGFGSATGRKVPMTVYYSTLSNIVSDVLSTFKEQVLDYMVWMKFGQTRAFSIEKVIPLKSQEVEMQAQSDAIEKTVQGENLSE